VSCDEVKEYPWNPEWDKYEPDVEDDDSTDVEKPIAWKLKDYLRSNRIYFEPSSNGNLVHFEVKANAQEIKQINDFIDSLDYSYITQDMMKGDEY
jgi:hypothetical protein